jgi:hypothetical protein
VEGSEALFWNPAGLARMEAQAPSDLSLSYNALLESSYSGTAAYARPYGDNGVLALGLVYFSQAALTSYNGLGDPTGTFAPNDLSLGGGYAHRFGRLHLGGALKMIRSSIDDVSGLTAALDAGMQVRQITVAGDGPVDAGVGFTNLGPPLKLGSAAPLPLTFRGGLLWYMTPVLRPSLEVHLPVDQAPFVCLGLEAVMKLSEKSGAKGPKRAALRLGYNQNQGRDVGTGLSGVSAGGGLDLGSFRIDYAWVPFGDLGVTNRFSLAFRL